MPIESIFSFLTYPKNHKKFEEKVEGVRVPAEKKKLWDMLGNVFDSAKSKRDVPIGFTAEEKVNAARSALIAFMDDPRMATAKPIAQSLQDATPATAGLGLFFLCVGADEGKPGKRLVLARFAADEGVVANRTKGGALTVEFVEQVFLKNAFSYKAATYRHEQGKDDAWKGVATDRQLNDSAKAIADYWIVHFLKSELTTSAAEGTRRLAVAMREASRSGDAGVRGEIVSAARLGPGIAGQSLTIDGFCERFALSDAARAAVKLAVKPQRLLGEAFRFDAAEFSQQLPYKQVELDNGVMLSAATEDFDQVLNHHEDGDVHTFSTSGAIVDEKLRINR